MIWCRGYRVTCEALQSDRQNMSHSFGVKLSELDVMMCLEMIL